MAYYVLDCEARLLPGAPQERLVTSHRVAILQALEAIARGEDPSQILTSAIRAADRGLPAAMWWELLCCGVLKLNAGTMLPEGLGLLGHQAGTTMRRQVEAFAYLTWLDREAVIVSFNGRGFDLPLLIATAFAEGVPMPAVWSRNIEDRYRGDGHIDIMDHLTMRGSGKAPSMDACARRIGWPGKGETDGSMVSDLWAAGDFERVGNYCLSDVVQQAAILLRLQLTKRLINHATFDEAARALIGFCEADTRVSELVSKVDRDRFLLVRSP